MYSDTLWNLFLALLFWGGIIGFCCLLGNRDSGSNKNNKSRTYNYKNNKTSSKTNYRRNNYGYGPYDPGEYYSEWGDDGGYE